MAVDADTLWKNLSKICRKYTRVTEIVNEPVRAFCIGTNRDLAFAFVSSEDATFGVHVRSAEASILGDPRFEPSRAFFLHGGRSNWVRLLDPTPDWHEVLRLVAKSYVLTSKPNEWTAVGDVHPILAKALEAAEQVLRPLPPYHAGGPTPKLKAQASLRIAIWAAESVGHLRAGAEAHDAEHAITLARAALDTKGNLEALKKASASKARDSRALGAARRAAGGAASLCKGKPDMVWNNAALAAERAVQALAQAHGAVTQFLSDLDQAVMREELEEALGAEKISRVLWRGAGEKGQAAYWVARQPSGVYGARRKVGARFAWITGSRDDALANVPDTLFDRAVAIALSNDLA
jgi:hypothetical protein